MELLTKTGRLSIKEVAEQLGVERTTVWRLINRGELKALRVLSTYRVSPADLAAYIAKNQTVPDKIEAPT